jgi:hypothetical protein
VWEDYVTPVRVENAFRRIAYAMYWVLERTHRRRGGSPSGRRVSEVLRGIRMGTIRPHKTDGMKLESDKEQPALRLTNR